MEFKVARSAIEKELNQKIYQLLEDYVELPPRNVYALDFGCGWMPYVDAFMNFFGERLKALTAVDLEEWELKWKRIQNAYPLVRFERERIISGKDFERLGRFDFISFINPAPDTYWLLNHPDPDSCILKVARELKSCLKKEGVVFVLTAEDGIKGSEMKEVLEDGGIRIEVYKDFRDIYWPHQAENLLVGRNRD